MNLGHVLIVHFTMQLKFRNCTCSVTSTPQRVELPGLRKYIWSFAGAMKYTVVCCNDIVLWSALLIITMDIKVLFVHSIASDQSVVDSKQALLQAVYILLLIVCTDQVSVCWYHHQWKYIMWVVSLRHMLVCQCWHLKT